VFIVGCPRSGTTWLQRLLASHPNVRTGQESDVFDLYIGPQLRTWRRELDAEGSGRGGVGLACYHTETEFISSLKRYALELLRPMLDGLGPGDIFVEKTPSHALFIPEILELFPGSRFIHVLRDARDTAASLLAASRGWGRGWAPRRATAAARMWVEHVRAVRCAAARLPREKLCEVRYESLHTNGLETARGVAGWLGLAWSEGEIEQTLAANRPEAARAGQGTPIPMAGAFGAQFGPVVQEPRGFVRRAQAGGWRDDLSLVDRMQVWRVAHRTMAEVGYPWPRPW
jgi:Sulfotransferase family